MKKDKKSDKQIIKPIHKLNNGKGATLCNKCNVMINTGITDELFCKKHKNKYDAHNVTLKEVPKVKYTLKRLDDGLTKTGYTILYIKWKEDRTADSVGSDIQLNRSLILDPGPNFIWMTTVIVEISQQEDKYIKFKTENSTYELIQHF